MGHPLFYLYPLSTAAEEAVNDPSNKRFRDLDKNGSPRLVVGLHSSKSSPNTLLTMGREGDIQLNHAFISRIQCSFEANYSTGLTMFYDRSHSQTCKVFGHDCTPFLSGRVRKVVVHDYLNSHIGMGGSDCELITFRIKWAGSLKFEKRVEKTRKHVVGYRGFERYQPALTIDYRGSSTHPMGEPEPVMSKLSKRTVRWEKIETLGKGAYGKAYKVFDIDLGTIMAVKIMRKSGKKSGRKDFSTRRREFMREEVQTLSSLAHVSAFLLALNALN